MIRLRSLVPIVFGLLGNTHILLFFVLGFASAGQSGAESLRFIPTTPENTTLADGSPLPGKIESLGWRWLPETGNSGAYESIHSQDHPASILMVKATGLEAGEVYEVFGHFWADDASVGGSSPQQHHSTQLGLSLATMHPFDGVRPDDLVAKEPWVITPGYKTGEPYGYQAVVEERDPLPGLSGIITTQGDSHLIRARLGYSRAGKDGTLPVFFSPNHGSRAVVSTMMDGITLRRATPDAVPDQGRKPGTRLHLAIRAGDPITIRRELEAGVDVNAFDEENLTPLFYAAACGNTAQVRDLLDHGAKPNQPAQSVSPLTAAATISNAEIVQLLLDAGAEVPTSPPKNKGALANDIDPRLLHPVVAAIRSGSVPALKMLLAANRNFSLPAFEEDLNNRARASKPVLNRMYFVGESMSLMNWDMTAFLIDQGVTIMCRSYSEYTHPDGYMLADAVRAWPDSRAVLEAMLRRGEAAVTKLEFRSEDALNTAALHGNAELVRRFLPLSQGAGPSYQTGLMENALSSENGEVIAMVRNSFPDAKVPRWHPDTKSEATPDLDAPAKRWFLPRTSPPPQTGQSQAAGKHVLAVVAAPDARDAGEILTTHASLSDPWHVVDRELIEAALGEGRFSQPWQDGEHRVSQLGDHLKADCLIVISAIRLGKETIHRYEVVEVATGMEIHREHFKGDAFVDKKEIAGFLERAARALKLAGANKRHQAVTLLSFSPQGPIPNALAATGLLRAAVQHEVDSTPGLISLSRAQSARLIEERALGGKDSVWGAAHMIEGSVAPQGGGSVKVTLRLETIKDDGVSTITDAEAVGKTTAIAETAATAWKKLMASSGERITATADQPADRNRALIEGRRLMREADWLHSIHADPGSYLPLIESAIALGVPTKETILLDLDARFREFMFLFPGSSDALPDRDHQHASTLQHLPDILHPRFSIAHSDQLVHKLPAARELLHQASWYLEHQGRDSLFGETDLWQTYGAYKSNEIWYAIQALCVIRALVYTESVPDESLVPWKTFSAELDELLKNYFSLLRSIPDPDPHRYALPIFDHRIVRKNPALLEQLSTMVAAGGAPTVVLSDINSFELLRPKQDLARSIIARMGDNPDHRLRLIKADLECFIAERDQRQSALRHLIDLIGETRWHIAPGRHECSHQLLSQSIIDAHTTTCLFDKPNWGCRLRNDGTLVPHVLLSRSAGPDMIARLNIYHSAFQAITQREIWGKNPNPTNIDPFRKSILGYYPWELRRLETESFKEVHTKGPHGGKSLRRMPPGITAGPESYKLQSMLNGAGKRQVKSVVPPKQAASNRNTKTLVATLIADLRTSGAPGTIIWPLVDSSDPNLLWVFHFPSDRDAICVNQAGGGGALNQGPVYDKRILYTAPWLLGIDCRDGSLIHKINLHTAVGDAYGIDLANRKCDVWGMALDQTKNRILTSVGWHDENYSGNKMGSVVIDKKTGKAYPISRNPEISSSKGNVLLDLWDRNNGVAAVGEHFFYLDDAGEWTGGAIQGVRSSELAVFQVFPDLSVKPLTMMGRRPELTPFDAQNRAPISINPHGNRLMAIHPSTIAEYDPLAGDWTITASLPSEKPTNKHTSPVADAQYWDYLRSLNELRLDGESTGWIAVSWWHPPGILPFASREKGWRNISINAAIPDDFLKSTFALEEIRSDKGVGSERKTLIKDHPRFKKSNVVVLAQTETDLILGMQTSDNYEWKHPSRNTHHLPFLWKISKQEILNYLNHE